MKRLKSYLSSIIIIHCFIAATLIRTISSTNTWPGDSSVTTVDKADEFGSKLSGLHYYVSESNNKISSEFLYGILNDPSTIYKLYWDGLYWKKYDRTLQIDFWQPAPRMCRHRHARRGRGRSAKARAKRD